ncbi:hypothetical protein BJV82DRAFT_709552 [Fennellomyces sp. T-0311]|nr:hypothetical protein BJV82DRAFT_709552 [Fennellomyces sp. T-0311]
MRKDEIKHIDEEQQPLLPNNSQKEEIYGLCLILTSTVCSVCMGLFIKLCGAESIPPPEIAVVQASLGSIPLFIGCAWKGVNPLGPPELRPWLIFYGAIAGLMLLIDAYCVTHMPLADFTVMGQLNVVFTTVLAALFLGESFRHINGFCIVVCLMGTIFISKPHFLFGGTQQLSLLPTIAALAAALIYSTISIMARKLRNKVYFLVFGIYSTFSALAISLPSYRSFVVPQTPRPYIYLVMATVCLFLTGAVGTRGLQLAPAGAGSIMKISHVIVAMPIGILMFQEYPDTMGLIGTCMIVFGTSTLLFAASRSRK